MHTLAHLLPLSAELSMEYDQLGLYFLHISSWKTHFPIVCACFLWVPSSNEAIQRGRHDFLASYDSSVNVCCNHCCSFHECVLDVLDRASAFESHQKIILRID